MADLTPLKHGTFPTWLGLVVGSWAGLAWGSLISLPIGIGLGVAAGSAFGGFLAVPLWGTVWGLIGLGRQRDMAVREHGISLLNENDPLAQRVYILAARLGLHTRPWVGVMPHNNAYAIGSNADNAMVVVGQPLLDTLSEAEVDAIIGHELGHIANNDMRRMGLARSFQNSLVWYLGFSETMQRWGRWLLTWVSELYVLSLSRKREYWADAFGAALTSKEHMIAALDKLHNGPDLSDFERKEARLMFRGIAAGSLLSTHPTLEERRAALEAETYSGRIPALKAQDALNVSQTLPKVEDISYVKKHIL
ncbi:M48 family metalloprotease [Agrobacterium tumefaciens]|uniref:M48 family metalloprotease n=1 Tax=Agrobacterium tumefaciens TaxID=358 RepID=UPI0015724598|nr:M48 family metalloprotease [Agrobacterium tumefaciens]NTD88376.1 M48 family metalloprotease [Agrobacterium tumefaciens]NTD91105.1 M48 family metalloprotease [Agrobacterium tumefaciens]NTD98551.1 M48 family metalloprotease [Agrobacterium tumefaciens]NTE11933.1 M48 family metalloprotease [Agrobacterium tumefaciens]NTE20009.1 M48 family metalloprotease [Agrobacterium tumefaciens]